MREAGERQRAMAKKDAGASGAKPRPAGPVREQRRRPTRRGHDLTERFKEAARRRAIERGRRRDASHHDKREEAAE